MKRIALFLFVTVSLYNVIFAQIQNDLYNFKYEIETNTTTQTFGDPTEFITNQISSDYGKRKCDGSRWHRGVDYGLGVQANDIRWDHFQ